MIRRTVAVVAAMMLADVSHARAQACLGQASFRGGAAHVGANYRTDIYAGEVGYGTATSWFGAAKFETWRPDVASQFKSTWNRELLTGGKQIAFPNSRVQICPIAGFGFMSGGATFTDLTSDFHGHQYEIGTALGITLPSDDSWHVIPSIAAKFIRQVSSGSSVVRGQHASYDNVASNLGMATATLGIARHGVALSPFLQRQLGTPAARNHWGIGASYNFGGRP